MTASPLRILAVTLGLMVAGALLGGIAGAVVLSGILIVTEGLARFSSKILLLAAVLGGMLGAVCAPLAGWLLLRHVPLGRAFGVLTIGTIVGGIAGWFLPLGLHRGDRSLIAGAVGFLCAAVVLRLRHARAGAA